MLKSYLLSVIAFLLFAATTQAQNWQTVQSANFRVFHVSSNEYGEKVAKRAEECRKEYFKRWLGKELTWDFKCDLYVYADKEAFGRLTGMTTSPAFARITFDVRVLREIHIYSDCEDIWRSILPHEIAHVCLARSLWTEKLPGWLDEGVAGQSESEVRIKEYQKAVLTKRLGARTLMNGVSYPKEGLYNWYSESITTIKYLVSLKDEATFNSFVKLGMQEGWQKALKTYYGFTTYEEFDDYLIKSLRGK